MTAGKPTAQKSGNPGGGGFAIGVIPAGGNTNKVLFLDNTGAVAVSAALAFDNGTNRLTVGALTSQGSIIMSNVGASGTPDLAFTGDPDTGLYSPAANQFGVALGGAPVLEIGAAGTPDSDQTMVMGRCRLDSRLTDRLCISHRDMTASGQQALSQTAAGTTQVNSATGQNLAFGINNSSVWFMNGTTFALTPGTDNIPDIGATASRIRNLFQGGYSEISEIAAPAAPGADKARLFCQDNGAGKTQLMVIFNTGAAQQIAIQP